MAMLLAPRQTLANYRVDRKIGEGGTNEVSLELVDGEEGAR